MPHVITVLADGFEEVDAVTIIDLLRRAGVEVTILGLDSAEVRGAHDLRVRADKLFKEFNGNFDAIVLPGGMPGTNNLAASEELLTLIRSARKQNKLCAAICAAPIVLAKAGILNNIKATCYPGCENRLTGAQMVEDAVVADGNIITSRAVGTAIVFSLKLIEVLTNKETAQKISSGILF
jgi:4-methyl-5(b-hydroxyethyl)-thiazole monophosphate biosynthesis